jgi:hypothetical protein
MEHRAASPECSNQIDRSGTGSLPDLHRRTRFKRCEPPPVTNAVASRARPAGPSGAPASSSGSNKSNAKYDAQIDDEHRCAEHEHGSESDKRQNHAVKAAKSGGLELSNLSYPPGYRRSCSFGVIPFEGGIPELRDQARSLLDGLRRKLPFGVS